MSLRCVTRTGAWFWADAGGVSRGPGGVAQGFAGHGVSLSHVHDEHRAYRSGHLARGAGMPGRHEAPKQPDPFIGLVVLALLVLLAVVIILAVA